MVAGYSELRYFQGRGNHHSDSQGKQECDMKKRLLHITLTTALFGSSAAFGANAGWHVGVSGGGTEAKDVPSAAELDAQNAADGFTTITSIDDTDTGWKLFAGYKFNRNFAVEGSYTDFGEATADSIVTASPFGTGTVDQSFEAATWGLAALGIVPLGYNFELFGKVGFHYWDAEWTPKVNLTGLSGSTTEDENGTDLFYGIGAGYNFTEMFGVRAEWELFKNIGDDNTTGETDVEMWSAGLQFRF